MNQPRITRRQIRCELIVRSDAAQARDAAVETVAARAPYTYAELAAANRSGTLAELLGAMDSYTLRAQAVRYAVESGGRFTADEVQERFVRLLSTVRFGRDG